MTDGASQLHLRFNVKYLHMMSENHQNITEIAV